MFFRRHARRATPFSRFSKPRKAGAQARRRSFKPKGNFGGGRGFFRQRRRTGFRRAGSSKKTSLFRSRGRVSSTRSSTSPHAKAAQAFRTGQVNKARFSSYIAFKASYASKYTIFLIAGDPISNARVLLFANAANTNATAADTQMCAVRDYKNLMFIKNVSTYQWRVRVTTWACRHEVPMTQRINNGTPSDQNIGLFAANGFAFASTAVDGGADAGSASLTDVSTSLFQNPAWAQCFKALKVKTFQAMPYRTFRESISVCKRKPGWISTTGNAAYTLQASDDTLGAWIAVRKMGGMTTMVKTIEIVGEVINDEGKFGDDLQLFNAPVVGTIQTQLSFDCANPASLSHYYVAGDANGPGATTGLTGQPWNYMFPSPSSTASVGTSVMGSALSAGGL